MNLVKSKQRVVDHGEVFTPDWLVEEMLNLTEHESYRIDSRFLESACGSGNFLVQVLKRKLATVESKYGKSPFEKHHHALLAMMSIYGIELLEDNAQECRENLLELFRQYVGENETLIRAAKNVLEVNIVQGNALDMTAADGQDIVFPEWAYLTKGRFQRRDFRFDNLTQRAAASDQDSLWQHFEEHEIFTPIDSYPPQSVEEIANV